MNDCALIVFGATGDLCKRKLMPALYHLVKDQTVDNLVIIGAAYEQQSSDQFFVNAFSFVHDADKQIMNRLKEKTYYQQCDVTKLEDVSRLRALVEEVERKHALSGNRLVYNALPPHLFSVTTQHLGESGLITRQQKGASTYQRIVYEKPFGSDLASAQQINASIVQWFDESQIYRIDHYLTKELISNIALVRFTNTIFEPLWNSTYIEYVHIILNEKVGLEDRGAYYDAYGVLKDVVQNHMLQELALVAMEEPATLKGNGIRDAKAQVLAVTQPVSGMLGQYDGYKHEKGVQQNSTTPTFAFITFAVNTPRWQNVPFYCSTGKRLDQKETIIRIKFRTVVCALPEAAACAPNYLTIHVAPQSGFSLAINAKKPGTLDQITNIALDFCHNCVYPEISEYRVIIAEIMAGEQSISVRFDEIEYAWKIIDKLSSMNVPLYHYKQGGKGPQVVLDLAKKQGLWW